MATGVWQGTTHLTPRSWACLSTTVWTGATVSTALTATPMYGASNAIGALRLNADMVMGLWTTGILCLLMPGNGRVPTGKGQTLSLPAHTHTTCVPVQAKHYSRDWIPKGRLRVQLKDAEGKPINPEVPDRKWSTGQGAGQGGGHGPARAEGMPSVQGKPAAAHFRNS